MKIPKPWFAIAVQDDPTRFICTPLHSEGGSCDLLLIQSDRLQIKSIPRMGFFCFFAFRVVFLGGGGRGEREGRGKLDNQHTHTEGRAGQKPRTISPQQPRKSDFHWDVVTCHASAPAMAKVDWQHNQQKGGNDITTPNSETKIKPNQIHYSHPWNT